MRAARVALATFALGAALALAGCSQRPEHVVRPLPDVPVPRDVVAETGASTVTLSWRVPDPSGVVRYRVYRANNQMEKPHLVDSTTATTMLEARLTNGVTYCFQISAVDASGFEGSRSDKICATPAAYSIQIVTPDGNTQVTKSATVTLRFFAPATTRQVAVTEDSTFATEILQPYPSFGEMTYTFNDPIPSHQGNRRVWARFIDESGTASIPVSAVIRYDGYAELDDVSYSPEGPVFVTGQMLHLSASAVGRESGAGATVEFSLVNATRTVSLPTARDLGQNGDGAAGDGIYEVDYLITGQTSKEISDATLVAKFTDNYGNVATAEGTGSLSINVPPTAVDITSLVPTSSTVQVTWTQSTVTDFAEYRLYYSTDSSLVAGAECGFCPEPPPPPNCATSGGLCWASRTSQQSTTQASVLELQACSRYYFRVYVRDSGGLSSASDVVGVETTGCP